MSAPHSIEPEYDLIFAGGGTTACITATRLATAFPELKILVLESGPTTKDKPQHIQPGQYITHLVPTSKTMQFWESKPSEHVAGRSIVIPSGRCIGGGSSVNFMLYNRPAASDFDDWENEFGNKGWSSKELIPLLQKAETYEIDPKKANHGSDGPLKVSYGGAEILDIAKQFLEIGPKFEKDRPWSDEGNGVNLASINVFFKMPKWIASNGRRSDVAHNYVYNKEWKNLSVLDGCLVNRVVIKDGVATGVEYLFDKRVYESSPQDIRTVTARKLVIVSAGAMGTPLILERSGVGRKDVLKKAGVPLVAELPGVGENYQDHAFAVTPYFADPETTTFDSIFRGEPATWGPLLEQWAKDGTGLMAANGVDAAIKMRPRPDELAELGPDFTEYWNATFANKPDKPLFWLSALAGLPADQSALPPLKFLSSGCFLGYPQSRGYLHISSSDPYASPDFESGFLSTPGDVAALRWGYKKGRELIRRLPAFRGALPPAHPQFAADSPAALTESGPIALDAPKVVYSAEDDKAIDTYLRQFVGTSWHSLGTCAMKPLEKGGVVDSNLNVYGVKNLKIADLSIPPSNVNSNTYSTTAAIGEKAALILAAELGGSL
ncbi:GMC oxidoreductase-domain-containing protein [Mycena alexandri]|uniref:GMC oxidoreductase-domain-containing protein n=1 Tax=Mycena alexandri TaxID=1745969 RepID=A0AAD6TIH5_9AGAR|nr:GMC oxidoreductase-domain-containing protein [Mycena alexandri]